MTGKQRQRLSEINSFGQQKENEERLKAPAGMKRYDVALHEGVVLGSDLNNWVSESKALFDSKMLVKMEQMKAQIPVSNPNCVMVRDNGELNRIF